MTFAGFRAANQRRCEETFHPVDEWSPTDWACALAGEVGEACNLIKKLRRLRGSMADDADVKRNNLKVKIGKELADVMAYLDLLALRLGIDLEAATIQKFNEVSARVGSPLRLAP